MEDDKVGQTDVSPQPSGLITYARSEVLGQIKRNNITSTSTQSRNRWIYKNK